MKTRDWNQLQEWDVIRHRSTGEAYQVGYVEKIPDSREAHTLPANKLTATRIVRASNPDEWEIVRRAGRDQNETLSKQIRELCAKNEALSLSISGLNGMIDGKDLTLAMKNQIIINQDGKIERLTEETRDLRQSVQRLRDSMLLVRKELEYSLSDGDPDVDIDAKLGDGTS